MIVTFLKYVHLYFSDETKAPSESVSDACWLISTNYCRVIAIVFFFPAIESFVLCKNGPCFFILCSVFYCCIKRSLCRAKHY